VRHARGAARRGAARRGNGPAARVRPWPSLPSGALLRRRRCLLAARRGLRNSASRASSGDIRRAPDSTWTTIDLAPILRSLASLNRFARRGNHVPRERIGRFDALISMLTIRHRHSHGYVSTRLGEGRASLVGGRRGRRQCGDSEDERDVRRGQERDLRRAYGNEFGMRITRQRAQLFSERLHSTARASFQRKTPPTVCAEEQPGGQHRAVRSFWRPWTDTFTAPTYTAT
jgi:hypothetical protein